MKNEEKVYFVKQLDQAITDGRINNFRQAAAWGADWAENAKAAEVAELLELLGEVAAFSPAGSDTIPQWIQTRVKVREILEKYGK